MRKYSLLIIAFLHSVLISGQITTAPPQVTRPSPTAESMMNFAEIPVNTYTGVPDINIPLYSFPTHSKDLSVNLSLNYHPAGISVLGKASDLGAGWNLTADGIISRTVINEPDEHYNPGSAPSLFYNHEFNDEYTFNFMGYSGRFKIFHDTITNTFSTQMMDNSTLKIEFSINPGNFTIYPFTVYDDKGYKYVFEQPEYSASKFWYTYPPSGLVRYDTLGYISSYHLTKVYDNNGKEIISYDYTSFQRFITGTTIPEYALKLTGIDAVDFGRAEINYTFGLTNNSLSDPVSMNSVVIKDVHGNLIKKFGFTSGLDYTIFNKARRFLNTVTEYDKSLVEVKSYGLTYKTEYTTPYECTDDYTFSSDFYGYATLMPKYVGENQLNYFQGPLDMTLPDVCKIGVLESMRLPTGGHIDYEFEANTMVGANGLDQPNGSPVDFCLNPDNYTHTVYASTSLTTTSNTTTWQFTVTGSTPKKLFLKGVFSPYTSPLSEDPSTPLYPSYSISGNGIAPFEFSDNYDDDRRYPCIGKVITLLPGTYTITVTKQPGTSTSGTITATEYVLNSTVKNWEYHAGVRIKRIAHFDSTDAITPAREINYDYQRFDDANSSSGQLYGGTEYFYTGKLLNAQMGYSNVKVSDTGNNGYVKYYYRPYDNVTAAYTPGTGIPASYFLNYQSLKTGLLEKSEVFDNTGRILSKTVNDFDIMQIGIPYIVNSYVGGATINSWAKITTRTSTSFTYDASNVQKATETTEAFTYNTVNRLVDEHTVSNSHGEVLKTKNYYHTGNSSLSQNRISELEKVETYRDTELLTTSQINYSNTFSGNVSYLPETVTTAKGSNTPETRLHYTAYDEFSNPLQVQQENGMVTSYIWGYHKTVPVAKIENLDYASIPSATITAIQNKSDSATGHGELRVLLNNLRTSFPDAMVTTMTYNPLIGLRTLTDPKGDSIKYEYDNFNRLKAVRDKDNHILTENEYHYKNTTNSQNYIKTKTYKVESTDFMPTPSVTQAVQGITYYDGLGRTIQKIANKQANNGMDIVRHIEYDVFGRQPKEYLPYVSKENNMSYINGTVLKPLIVTQYLGQYGESNPYSEKLYEPSPLNRVIEQAAPGKDWSLTTSPKHTIRFDYQTNGHNEVKLFTATSDFINNTITLNNGSGSVFYNDTELYKTIAKNENWKAGDGTDNTTEEFKDKEGRTVLSRKYNGSEVYDTYNVYDQYGNLAFVIPPIADSSIGTTELNELCYQYKYDYRNRLIEKKLPGKQWEYIAYNSQDKPVATGPALNPFTGKDDGWLITKYDIFGRIVCTGWLNFDVDSSNRLYIESQVDGSSWYEQFSLSPVTVDNVAMSYTNNIYPTDFKVLTINYYDGYDFTGAPATMPSTVETQPVLSNVKGLPTGSWVRVLTKDNETFADESYILYDKKARPVRTHTTNYLGGLTRVDSRLTFTGTTEYTKTGHKRSSTGTEFNILDTFYYTNQDRLSKHTQKINSGPTETINENVYDNLGQLIRKDVGGTGTAYQKVDYTYNIRGWLLGINDVANLNVGAPASDPIDLFAFGINYNKSINNDDGGVIVPQYNGNIAETNWRSATDDILRRYGYTYDKLNRLTKAVYQKPNNTVPVTQMYNERIDYDKNGNITLLKRNGDFDSDYYSPIEIDFLEYHYKNDNPNLLLKVTDSSNSPKGFSDDTVTDPTDSSDDYDYDLYGNLISDENKGIESISYNHLNLPIKISFATGDKIEYLYDALGEKVRKTVNKVPSEVITDYLDGFQYVNGNLDFIGQPEGYVKATYCDICPTGTFSLNYVYQYKDHLGNIRLSYGYDQKTDKVKIIGEDHYYPYGLKHTRYNTGEKIYSPDEEQAGKTALIEVPSGGLGMNNYKYNGKEWQDELGLNMYAMDMRQYDPAIARWVVQDPIVHHSQSPYNGYDGNPVFFADPSGGDTNALMGADFAGNERYNSNGLFTPWRERQNARTGFSEMDNDIGIGADGDVFNEVSVHVDGDNQGDQTDPPGKQKYVYTLDPEVLENLAHPFNNVNCGALEFIEGGAALKLIKVVKEAKVLKKTIVIGEDMVGRVIPFAEKNGFKYFKPRGKNSANFMKNQTKWMYRQIKDETVRILDYGPKGIEATSKYYKRELEMAKKYLDYLGF